MSLAQKVIDLATRVATECKALRTLVNGNATDLSSLTTTSKTSLVSAINELKAALGGAGAVIADGATATTTTWSSTKITDAIATALTALTSGAPGALDTLDELAAALGDDANFAATITTALGNRLRIDAAQSLTAPQKAFGLANLGAASAADMGDPTTDFVTTFNTGLL